MYYSKFDKLNQQTRDYNNGITRNINPTDYCGGFSSSSARRFDYYNSKTYYENNGLYCKKYF